MAGTLSSVRVLRQGGAPVARQRRLPLSLVPAATIVKTQVTLHSPKGPTDAERAAPERAVTNVPHTHWARTVDGACIAYQDLGEGPVTLVVDPRLGLPPRDLLGAAALRPLHPQARENMRVLHFDKRGVGMSDRLTGPPGLDVADGRRARSHGCRRHRAGGVFGWGPAGPALACMFAATSPSARRAGHRRRDRLVPRLPWSSDERGLRGYLAAGAGLGRRRARGRVRAAGLHDSPVSRAFAQDPAFLAWSGRFMRCAATPASYKAFDRMWTETDVRDVLPSDSTCRRWCSAATDRHGRGAGTRYRRRA